MTDIRDRDRPIELATAARPARRNLVARALFPTRRAKAQDLVPASPGVIEVPGDLPYSEQPKRRFSIVRWSLFFVVCLPMLISGIYLFAFSSDQYSAEARFAVRQAQGIGSSDMESDSSSSGNGKSGASSANATSLMTGAANLGGQDAEIVANYIHSRAIVENISRTLDIRAIFQRPEADFWARLPETASADDLTAYWNSMVSVYVEGTSGIVTVSASAFRREDALALTAAVLHASETLVNTMSEKIRADAMQTAENEVRLSEEQVRFALSQLTDFRNSKHLIDPVSSSEANGKLLQQLLMDKIDAEAQLFVAERSMGANAPGMTSLRAKLESINNQVIQLKDEMAGGKEISSNMAATISDFEQLELKRQFSERMYGFARDGVERARIASERQQIYLATFVPPSLPQDFSYPLRWTDFLLITFIAFMFWVCGATIIASIQDHRL
jgi:capsular polysaccharide transport system permease protein